MFSAKIPINFKKLSVGQYHQMVESGILSERDRVELIEGVIIEMSPIGRRHAACVDRLTELFILSLASKAIVRTQSPVQLSDDSEPQPDLAILKRRDDFYSSGHPKPADISLLVEVSDTTIEFDREVKILLYAQEGIPEVWLVDLNAQVIKIFQQPTSTGYQRMQLFKHGQIVTLPVLPKIQFTVDQVFG